MLRGVGSDVWPCWARNLLFIVLGMLMQPNVLLLPLLESDAPSASAAPEPQEEEQEEEDEDEEQPGRPTRRGGRRAARGKRSQSETTTRRRSRDDRGTARRQRYGSTRMTLISTMPGKKKTVFLSHFYLNVLFLPRQARDRHRESTQKKIPFIVFSQRHRAARQRQQALSGNAVSMMEPPVSS